MQLTPRSTNHFVVFKNIATIQTVERIRHPLVQVKEGFTGHVSGRFTYGGALMRDGAIPV